jgi:hypothetical protein
MAAIMQTAREGMPHQLKRGYLEAAFKLAKKNGTI